MATKRQKNFVRGVFTNVRKKKKKSLGKIAREAGYSDGSSKQPSRIINAVGTKDLADKLGLTEEFLFNCLKTDIKNKPGDREKELDMGFKIQGSYAQGDQPMIQPIVNINLTSESIEKAKSRIEGKIAKKQ